MANTGTKKKSAAAKPVTYEDPDAAPVADDQLATGEVVQYIGLSHIREIDSRAYAQVGVEDMGKTVWEQKNNWSLPVEQFTDDALVHLTENEGGEFVVKSLDIPRA